MPAAPRPPALNPAARCCALALTLSVWLALGLVLGVAHPARAAELLRLAHQFPAGSLPDRTARTFAQELERRSRGALRLQVHPAGTFGDEREHLAQLRKGALDLALTGDLVINSLSDRLLVVNLPFLYRDTAHALTTYNGPVGQAIRRELDASGFHALAWYVVGQRLLTANRPIHNVQDLQGLKLRLPADAAWTAAWRALGAQVRPVQFTDLAVALKTGLVEAQENPPSFIRSGQLYRHQKYLMTTQHMPQRQFIFISTERWQQLPAAHQQILTQAAQAAATFAHRTAEAEHQQDVDWLTHDGGMTLVPFDASGVPALLHGVPAALAGAEGETLYRRIQDGH